MNREELCKKQKRSTSRSVSYTALPEIDFEKQDLNKIIKLGVCAMAKKIQSDSMQQILMRLNNVDEADFEIIIFEEQIIFSKKIHEWPIVDALITFYSDGFPFLKVKEYCELRRPFLINDINKQEILWNRKLVYKELRKAEIPIPKHFFVTRDKGENLKSKYENAYNCLEDMTLEDKKFSHVDRLESTSRNRSRANSNEEDWKKHGNDCSEFDKRPSDMISEINKYFFFLKSLLFEEENSAFYHTNVEQYDDYLEINGIKLAKPIVEKPYDAEDHCINIYYPLAVGGGTKKLFRKIGNTSSEYFPNNNEIRIEGNFIYEEFLPTDGFDIKVYTVGEDYFHAEARKSPCLDGKVERSLSGKELRYPVNLTAQEKIMARKVVYWFGQNICGFDLLRSKGKSYICDVNGWSFVKGNSNYYRDCAFLLRKMILAKLAPKRLLRITQIPQILELKSSNILTSLEDQNEDEETHLGEELRSVVAIFRHGDRTPKQKMKMKITYPEFLAFFNDRDPRKEIKIKKADQMQRFLDITRDLILRGDFSEEEKEEDAYHENNATKLLQLQSILEKGGHFDEITRKIQLRPLKFVKNEDGGESVIEALMILKWGGELTHSGEQQAEEYGKNFRLHYNDSGGIMRLHNSYRHDLKIYASDEGRCLKTAAAFCKGFLNLEGELIPITVSMVRKDPLSQRLLDFRAHDLEFLNEIKKDLSGLFNRDANLYEAYSQKHDITKMKENKKKIMKEIVNPQKQMVELYSNIQKLTQFLSEDIKIKSKTYYILPTDLSVSPQIESFLGCGQENMVLILKRWRKLEIDFFDSKRSLFNISKIPDIFDSIKYDILHNRDHFNSSRLVPFTSKIFEIAKLLASFVVPYEYGGTPEKKTEIGLKIISPLLSKIRSDLLWWRSNLNEKRDLSRSYQEESAYYLIKKAGGKREEEDVRNNQFNHIRTRLYFTSASHLYSLFNVVYYNAEEIICKKNKKVLNQINQLHYLSHLIFKLYENKTIVDASDPRRFRLELYISPGCKADRIFNYPDHLIPIVKPIISNDSMSLDDLNFLFNMLLGVERDEEPRGSGKLDEGIKEKLNFLNFQK